MKKFTIVLLGAIFITLIANSIQSVTADDSALLGVNIIPTKDSEFQVHLQVVIRDSQGQLVSVTESISGWTTVALPGKMITGIVIVDNKQVMTNLTDNVFDKEVEKEIVTVDDIKYEKVQYVVKDRHYKVPYKLMFFIPAIIEVSYGSETIIVDAFIFQAFVPLVYLEDDDVVDTQWTIFRKLN